MCPRKLDTSAIFSFPWRLLWFIFCASVVSYVAFVLLLFVRIGSFLQQQQIELTPLNRLLDSCWMHSRQFAFTTLLVEIFFSAKLSANADSLQGNVCKQMANVSSDCPCGYLMILTVIFRYGRANEPCYVGRKRQLFNLQGYKI